MLLKRLVIGLTLDFGSLSQDSNRTEQQCIYHVICSNLLPTIGASEFTGALSFFDTLITVSKSAEQKRNQLLAMSTVSFAKITSSRAAVNSCPSEMIDQIGGWSSGKVGEGYGEGYFLDSLLNAFQIELEEGAMRNV